MRDVDTAHEGRRGYDRLERGGQLVRDAPLVPSGVGAAEESDLSVAPSLLRDPLHRIEAVRPVVAPLHEFAARAASTATVDGDERQALACELDADRVRVVGEVGRHLHDGRDATGARRQVEHGTEFDAVTHRDLDESGGVVAHRIPRGAWRARLVTRRMVPSCIIVVDNGVGPEPAGTWWRNCDAKSPSFGRTVGRHAARDRRFVEHVIRGDARSGRCRATRPGLQLCRPSASRFQDR